MGLIMNGLLREEKPMIGRPRLLRDFNAQHILRLLRLYGPCSRADLARYSGLSAPTISSGVAFLKENGLVDPMGPGPSKGGRPPIFSVLTPKRVMSLALTSGHRWCG